MFVSTKVFSKINTHTQTLWEIRLSLKSSETSSSNSLVSLTKLRKLKSTVSNSGSDFKTAFGVLTQQRTASIDLNKGGKKAGLQKVSALWLSFVSISVLFPFTLLFLVAAKSLDVSYCFSYLGCTVLTSQMHVYCHKPSLWQRPIAAALGTFHSTEPSHITLASIQLKKENSSFASPFKPLATKTVGRLAHRPHADPLPWGHGRGRLQKVVRAGSPSSGSRHTSVHPNIRPKAFRL